MWQQSKYQHEFIGLHLLESKFSKDVRVSLPTILTKNPRISITSDDFFFGSANEIFYISRKGTLGKGHTNPANNWIYITKQKLQFLISNHIRRLDILMNSNDTETLI